MAKVKKKIKKKETKGQIFAKWVLCLFLLFLVIKCTTPNEEQNLKKSEMERIAQEPKPNL